MKDELFKSKYRITLKFQKTEQGTRIDISNNAKIIGGELDRINFRLVKAVECANFVEAYEKVYDPLEGAGLGIILAVMLLKNAGIGTDKFSIKTENDLVIFTLIIPEELRDTEITSTIKDRLVEEVKSLPTFPEHIMELQALCSNPDTSIDLISKKISMDPSLTADVLRISNTAGFITGKRVTKINEAVMIIGLKNLNAILTAASSKKILDKRYRKFERIWEHCNRTAFYARQIALETRNAAIADSAYIGGLLHDIGKIVLLSTDLELVNQISEIVEDRKLRTSTIVEEVSIGISHSAIGSLIARKWNFPGDLVEAIEYHHSPLNPEVTHREIVITVYLANMFCEIETRNFDFTFIENEVLRMLGGDKKLNLEKMHKKLNRQYNRRASE
jgi:putative nucleotidyltransferase with HDIG domain